MYFDPLYNSIFNHVCPNDGIQRELLAMRNSQLNRRLYFENIAAENLQEQRLMREAEIEKDHEDHVLRINRLRREGEALEKDKLFRRFAFNEDIHHKLANKASQQQRVPQQKQYFSERQQKRQNISRSLYETGQENKRESLGMSYHYKGKLAHQIKERWVPFNVDPNDQIQKQKQEHERWFSEIEKKISDVKNKVHERKEKEKENETFIYEARQSGSIEKGEKNKKHVSFIEEPSACRKSPDNMRNDHGSNLKSEQKRSYGQLEEDFRKIKERSKKFDSFFQNQTIDRSFEKKSSNKNQSSPRRKNPKTKSGKRQDSQLLTAPNSGQQSNLAIQRIKNRLQLSSVVFEDSEHRTINHQKNHLSNKYDSECRMRKEIVNKICNSKGVEKKYHLILQ